MRSNIANKVAVLVRADDAQSGLARIKGAAETTGWWCPDDENKVEVWVGNLADESLGLNPEQLLRLKGEAISEANIDAIIHCGASVYWSASYERLEVTNVNATVDLLKIVAVSAAMPKFVYVSGGLKDGVFKTTAEFSEELANSHNGYFQTKAVSESIIQKIAAKLPAGQNRISVVRPGLIIGAAATGAANGDDILWRFVATASTLQKYPVDPVEAWLPLAGADTVAETVINQIFNTKAIQPFVDMLEGMYMSEVWEIMKQELREPCAPTPRDEWIELATAKIEEVGRKHPMWGLDDYLSRDRWMGDVHGGHERSAGVESNLRNSIRHLQDVGYICFSVDDIGKVNGKVTGRSGMM